MEQTFTCSRCGKTVAENELALLCPDCLPPAASASVPVTAETNRTAAVVWLLVYVGYLAFVFASAPQLPERVATHFGAEGRANGWMTRQGYLIFETAFPLAIGLFLAGTASLTSRFPARFVNLPRKDFWLAPERRALTAGILRSRMTWLASLMTLFFGGLHALTLEANRVHPPQLPMDGLLLVVVAFLVAVLIWVSLLLMRFAETGERPRGDGAGSDAKRAPNVLRWIIVGAGFHLVLGVGLLAVQAIHGINDRDASFALALLFHVVNYPTVWTLRLSGVDPTVPAVFAAGFVQWIALGAALGGARGFCRSRR